MKEIPSDKKAQVLAGIAVGKTVREVSKETGVSIGTISRIRQEIPETLKRIETEKQQTFGGLLALHFQNQVAALDAYAKHTSTQEYIRTQTASDMAALHGAVAGHIVRVLDIASRVGVGHVKRAEE